MTTFAWTGKTKSGVLKKGELSGGSSQDIIAALRKKSIVVTSIKEKSSALNMNISFGTQKVTLHDLVIYTRMFSTMIDAGLPLVQCLDILGNQAENPTMKTAVNEVRQNVESGSTYADALKKHSTIFDTLYCNMVAAGEAGGILDVILGRLAKHMEKAMKLKAKIKSAMTYPITIVIIAFVVIAVLLTFVIPKFADMFAQFGADLPALTRFVMDLSEFMQANIMYMLGIIFLIRFLVKKYYKTEKGRYKIDSILLNLPVLGILLRKAAVAGFTRTLGTLISSGVPILEGLTVVASTAGNAVIEEAILKTKQSISEGKTIAEPLGQSNVFPPMVVQMISVGETTGALDIMLGKIADFYDDEVDIAVDNLTSMMEPMIMAFLGVTIGFIVIAMYLPIFKMASAVG